MCLAALWGSVAHASDHIDGHATRRDRRADLADLYAWTPEAGRVAVALTSAPLSRRRARPDEGVHWVIRVRRVGPDGADTGEWRLTCGATRGPKRTDVVACTSPTAELRVPWGGSVEADGLRVFAGVRRDPFFIALGKVAEPHPRDGERRSRRGVDFLHNGAIRAKVRALVVELDAAAVPGEAALVGVVAESLRDGRQLDRLGRAEVANFVLASRFGTRIDGPDVRDAYNGEDAFALTPGHVDDYQRAAAQGLARLDALDGAADWPSPHPLRDLLLDDWLVVDPDTPCTVETPSFLEIESAWLAGEPHATCGGRTPNADAVDRLLTWTVNGPDRVDASLHGPPGAHAPHRGDGVDRPGAPATDFFPFLEEPR